MKYIFKLTLFLIATTTIGCSSFHYVKTGNPQAPLNEIVSAGENEDLELTPELSTGLQKLLQERVASPESFDSEKTIETIIALQKLSPETGKMQFITLLKDKDEEIRYHSADALGEVRSSEVIPALIDAIEDEEDIVADSASRSLSKLTLMPIHKDDDPNIAKWKEWWQANQKYFLIDKKE